MLFALVLVSDAHPPPDSIASLLRDYAILVYAVCYEPLVELGSGDGHLCIRCVVGVLLDEVYVQPVLIQLDVWLKGRVVLAVDEPAPLDEVVTGLGTELTDR